jgi:hypothetical protein
MNQPHEVISAFLDDEPFDPSELAEALSDRTGRDLLIDLVALRHLVQVRDEERPTLRDQNQTPWRSSLRAVAAAAAVLVALVGGYLIGERRTEMSLSGAPQVTRVVEAPAAWQDVPPGGVR